MNKQDTRIELSCDGKKKFRSHDAAKRALRTANRYKLFSKEYHVYQCEWCHYWHIGCRW
jgi:hypothetical protein